MNDKICRAEAATEAASRERDAANNSARDAAERMMRTLRRIIGEGNALSGLPNLAISSSPYRGVRVRAKKADEELPRNGRAVLCISIRGHLVYACRSDRGTEEKAALEYVRADMAEDIAEAMITAIDYHLAGCDRAEKRYAELTQLSERIVAALTPEEGV